MLSSLQHKKGMFTKSKVKYMIILTYIPPFVVAKKTERNLIQFLHWHTCLSMFVKETGNKKGYKKLEDVGWTCGTVVYDVAEGKGTAMQKQIEKLRNQYTGQL